MAIVQTLPSEVFGTAFQSLLGLVNRGDSGDRTRPTRLKSESVRAAADEVFAAETRDQLRDLLDDLSGDERFLARLAERGSPSRGPIVRQLSDVELDVESLEQVLGQTATARCVEGLATGKEAVAALFSLFSALEAAGLTGPGASADADRNGPGGLYALAYDLSVPATLRRALAGLLRFAAASAVIARAEERGEKLEPWFALALADTWASGPESLADAMSSRGPILGAFVADIELTNKLDALLEQWQTRANEDSVAVFSPFDADAPHEPD